MKHSRRETVVALACVVLLAGCAQPEVAPTPTLDEDLGAAPTITETEPSPAAVPTPATDGTTPAATAPAPSEQPTTGPSPTQAASTPATEEPRATPSTSAAPAAPATPTPVVLLAVGDASGDHGPRGPAWTDLRSVELVEVGNDLRVTMRFDGLLPSQPPDGEVPLLGVNIGDEGYQLFVEGGGASWTAYLDTPQGFVPYPGTFELAGRAMVLQVPFNELGSPTRAPVTVFVEWSRDSGLVGALNPTSEDRLDGEPHRFDRAP